MFKMASTACTVVIAIWADSESVYRGMASAGSLQLPPKNTCFDKGRESLANTWSLVPTLPPATTWKNTSNFHFDPPFPPYSDSRTETKKLALSRILCFKPRLIDMKRHKY